MVTQETWPGTMRVSGWKQGPFHEDGQRPLEDLPWSASILKAGGLNFSRHPLTTQLTLGFLGAVSCWGTICSSAPKGRSGRATPGEIGIACPSRLLAGRSRMRG